MIACNPSTQEAEEEDGQFKSIKMKDRNSISGNKKRMREREKGRKRKRKGMKERKIK
jgi:hypothetical protein